jgi:hypothetical protein
MAQTFILDGLRARSEASRVLALAPHGSTVKIEAPKRTIDQNAKLWAMLSDVSRAKPDGRHATPEVWKALFMHACGHAVQFEMGLNGQPFPVGFRTSKMTKDQMRDLLDFIQAWGAENGVRFGDEVAA